MMEAYRYRMQRSCTHGVQLLLRGAPVDARFYLEKSIEGLASYLGLTVSLWIRPFSSVSRTVAIAMML